MADQEKLGGRQKIEAQPASDISIGSTVWRFDENYRVYRDKSFSGGRGPIYREHWRESVIIGENSRSWLIANKGVTIALWKAPKKGPHPGFAFSVQEVDDDCWVNSNRGRITNAVMTVKDANSLREIARIIGWTEDKA